MDQEFPTNDEQHLLICTPQGIRKIKAHYEICGTCVEALRKNGTTPEELERSFNAMDLAITVVKDQHRESLWRDVDTIVAYLQTTPRQLARIVTRVLRDRIRWILVRGIAAAIVAAHLISNIGLFR